MFRTRSINYYCLLAVCLQMPTFFLEFNTFGNAEKLFTEGLSNLQFLNMYQIDMEVAEIHAKYLTQEDEIINIKKRLKNDKRKLLFM